MIGNDIVDIKEASIKSNWERKGFLNKIFSKEEQALILNAKNSFNMVWLLWTMKESAYKIYVQQHNKRFYAPIKMKCSIQNETEGIVSIYKNKYFTKSKITKSYIFTRAALMENPIVLEGNFSIKKSVYSNQHVVTNNLLKQAISKKWNMAFKKLEIKKNNLGVPHIFNNNTQLSIPFSTTHHGNYGAFTILN